MKEKFKCDFKSLYRNDIKFVDEIIVFNSLQENELMQIVDLMLNNTIEALKQKDISFKITDSAKKYILEKGTNIKFGARPLRRSIQKNIDDEISEMILKGELTNGQTINIDLINNELSFKAN